MRGTSGTPRHTKQTRYRCSLPGLAEFTGNRCTEPEVPHIGGKFSARERSLTQRAKRRKPTSARCERDDTFVTQVLRHDAKLKKNSRRGSETNPRYRFCRPTWVFCRIWCQVGSAHCIRGLTEWRPSGYKLFYASTPHKNPYSPQSGRGREI